jgi:hypothetical protein
VLPCKGTGTVHRPNALDNQVTTPFILIPTGPKSNSAHFRV